MARHEHGPRGSQTDGKLRSGMSGSGGRVTSGNGHASLPTRIFRDER